MITLTVTLQGSLRVVKPQWLTDVGDDMGVYLGRRWGFSSSCH